MDALYNIHKEEFGSAPQVITAAPGLVNLLGGHTEYNEGYLLQAAVSQTVKVAISARDDNALRFFAADYSERKRTTIPNLKFKREDRWANYIKGICVSFLQYGFPLRGMNISVIADLQAGVGLASSAALETAAAEAIRQLFSLEVSKAQFLQIVSRVENDFIKTYQSLKGPLGCFLAKEGTAMFIDMRSLSVDHIPLTMDGCSFVITDSSIPVICSREETEHRREKCRTCVELLSKKRPGTALRDYSENDLKQGMGLVPEPIRRLCMHVVSENTRVLEGKKALKKRDYVSFGKIMNRSHESLRDNYEVSCPELDWLIKRACETDGVLGSRMNGPGFCGSTVSLIRDDCLQNYMDQINDYEHIFGFAPKVYPLASSAGVRVLFP
ncbi:MAG: galactokinase [Spirochaetales bacterium]|nr:galactokinase [Spirochaetales bacterium]